MVNDVCNLSCNYCFANKYVNGDTSTDISYKNFKKAVDWINYTSDMVEEAQRVALIGGEPLLHNKLLDLLDYAVKTRRPMQEILIFTNGILADKYADYFARNDISLLLNINSPEDIGETCYSKVIRSIEALRQKGVDISIGINLYKKDLNLDFIYDIIERFSFSTLRVGVSCPNSKETLEQGAFKFFEEIKDKLMELTEEAAKRGCGIHVDCQKIPFCVMENEAAKVEELEDKYNVNIEITNCSKCEPVIDILPNLEVVRCFGMSGTDNSVPMDAFETELEAADYFRTQFDNMANFIPMNEKCVETSCKEMYLGRCQGGCLAYKVAKLQNIKEKLAELTAPERQINIEL